MLDEGQRCPNYQYTITQILTSVKCLLGSSVGFRALSSVFRILQESILSLATPVYTTTRQWLFKLGLYKLNRLKDMTRRWFFIIDTSIQMGLQKCVVVLGVPQTDLRGNFCLSFGDVEPLVVRPLYSSPGEVIQGILEEAAEKTGSPLAVISDQGAELKRGVRLFSEDHLGTVHLFDISHRIDSYLRKELENDECWVAFKKSAKNAIQNLKLSTIAHLAPPKQRSKSRMHSAFFLIQWGLRVLDFLNSEKVDSLSTEEKDKIKWLKNYQFSLPCYMNLMEICKKVLSLVHEKGYHRGVAEEFLVKTKHLCQADKKNIAFQNRIKMMLQEEEQKVPEGEHYFGSSEIIESLFGKFKTMEDHHASSGLTSLVLALPALVGGINKDIIQKALETISVKDITNWTKKNVGNSFLSKRRFALGYSENNIIETDLEPCDF